MKFTTPVNIEKFSVSIGLQDRILILGSCFADEIGSRMNAAGFDVMINPFGTLYNPESIASAVHRLESGKAFTKEDCVEMGAGAGRICSFSHHTSFARKTAEEFLDDANASLERACEFWKGCNRVIVTLGTSMVWKRNGQTVSNCLKRPASEFTHEMLTLENILSSLSEIAPAREGRRFLFTVSPIRHLAQGAHTNTVSKARLQVALDMFLEKRGDDCSYFPACELLLDELRDYRFYADDMCHPSTQAANYIWERFIQACVPQSEWEHIKENERQYRRSLHRSILD